MADEKNMVQAMQMYRQMCAVLEERGWSFDRDEERLLVYFGVHGDDIPMKFIMVVEPDREVVRLMSMLPFEMSESKRVEGAIAACAISNVLAEGNFDYDLSDGKLTYRLVQSYKDSQIGNGLLHHMISMACAVVDHYNEKLLALDKGYLSMEQFLENI